MRHNQKNAPQWQALIQDQKSGGLTIRGWCDKNGIKQSCFFYWKRRLLAKAEQASCSAEISLVNLSADPVPPAADFDALSESDGL